MRNGMAKRVIGIIFLAVLSVLAAGILLQFHPGVLRRELQFVLNENTKQLFNGSVRLGNARLDRNFRLRIEQGRANLQTKKDEVPVGIDFLQSEKSLLRLFSKKGFVFNFEGARVGSSSRTGASGRFHFRVGRDFPYELEAKIHALGLEDLAWLNPQNLEHAEGNLNGEVLLQGSASKSPVFRLSLATDEAGGFLKASVFDVFLSYVPQVSDREAVKSLIQKGGLIAFQRGSFRAELIEPDRLKVVFRMLVLEYNLDLNLNIEIRIDEKNAFPKLVKLMGLFQGKTK